MKEKLIEIISEVNPFEEISEDTELIESGIVDSLSLVYIINQIQMNFGVEFPEELLQAENFVSVNKIEEIVNTLK